MPFDSFHIDSYRQKAMMRRKGAGLVFVLFSKLLHAISRKTTGYIAVAAVLCILAGALLFAHFEHKSIWTALYWAVTTATTVGYGDVSPSTPAGRIIAVGVMVTTIPLFGTLFSVLAANFAETKMRRLMGMVMSGPLRDHVILLGNGDEILGVVDSLKGSVHIVVVSEEMDPAKIPPSVSYVKGDPRDPSVLARVKPQSARHALITGAKDGEILEIAIALKEAAPQLKVTVSTKSTLAARALKAIGVENTVLWNELLGNTLAKSLQAPHAADLLLHLVNSEEFIISEVKMDASFVGKTLIMLRSSYPGYVLGLVQNNEVIMGVRRDPTLQPGDTLLVLEAH